MVSYGVLGVTFTCVRILEAVCIVPIIGMVSNFVGQAISSNQPAPQVFVGILSIVSIFVSLAVM